MERAGSPSRPLDSAEPQASPADAPEQQQQEDLEEDLRRWFWAALDAALLQPGEHHHDHGAVRQAVWRDLVRRHGEAQRHYHTLAHLHAMMRWLKAAFACPAAATAAGVAGGCCHRAAGPSSPSSSPPIGGPADASAPSASASEAAALSVDIPPEVAFSVLFHDAVYNPRAGAGDNERQSAQLARAQLEALGVPEAVVQAVEANVLATARHEPTDVLGPEGHQLLFLDADLAVLAARPRHVYDNYAAAIRREYAHVPDPGFRAGRAAVLRRFLDRAHLYFTAHARDCLGMELRARSNVLAEIQALEGGAPLM